MTRITPADGFAIVTGAGSGLGRALARQLCDTGFTVIGTGRRAAALEETGATCAGRFTALPMDVSDFSAVRQGIAEVTARHGALALLINNAAVYPKRDVFDETPELFWQSLAINLGGVYACSWAALQDMAPRGTGRILNVASYADIAPLPASAAYSVSKGAQRVLTRALIADLFDRFPGIVLTDWLPGALATGMGIPDGLPPETAAQWGVKLALMRDEALNGAVFERDMELLPPRGLKTKLKDTLMMRRPRPRRL
ncbi:SDR family NAD(P)-dependent oxidoreductase [Mameliella sp. AT18]|uniref:SDR family oxidoreductase n=1 Tax=Mameliella sp. AT18 TaxID=3028385 RepID=UPI000841096A|nr:SDR family oxidoreductase [Mameliella sp. AT18]MDD9729399.1 SDR family NAD(P)-dependent oxidoreductase [Mameliella sp. AT18]ODM46848.1 oxidoreductase [Ruegeria sp. PBVC088]